MFFGALLGFAAASLGWQVNLVAIHNGLRHERLGVLLTGLGATLADAIILGLGFVGIGRLLKEPGWLYAIKALSLATIATISARLFFYHPDRSTRTGDDKWARSFLMGFLLVIGNPGIWVLWIATVSFLMTNVLKIQDGASKMLFIAGFFLGALIWFSLLGNVILKWVKTLEVHYLHWIPRIAASLLLLTGLILVIKK